MDNEFDVSEIETDHTEDVELELPDQADAPPTEEGDDSKLEAEDDDV